MRLFVRDVAALVAIGAFIVMIVGGDGGVARRGVRAVAGDCGRLSWRCGQRRRQSPTLARHPETAIHESRRRQRRLRPPQGPLGLLAAGGGAAGQAAGRRSPPPTRCRRSGSPTPATCSGRSSSPPRWRRRASSRSSAARWRSTSATARTSAGPGAAARADLADVVLIAADEAGYWNLVRLVSEIVHGGGGDGAPARHDRPAGRACRRPDLPDRRPRRADRPGDRGGAGRPRRRAPRPARRHLRRPPLRRTAAARACQREGGRAGAHRPRLRPRAAAGGDQRGLLRHPRGLRGPRRADRHRRGFGDRRRQPPAPFGRALFQVARRDGGAVRGPARGDREHAGNRHALRVVAARAQADPAALCRERRRRRSGRGGDAGGGGARGAETAPRRPRPGAGAERGRLRQAARIRARRHPGHEIPRLLPDRRRLHPVGQAQRHPGRAGARLGRRLGGRLVAHHHRPRSACASTSSSSASSIPSACRCRTSTSTSARTGATR